MNKKFRNLIEILLMTCVVFIGTFSLAQMDSYSIESVSAQSNHESGLTFSANDYKNDSNSWADAIQAAFNDAKAVSNTSNVYVHESGSRAWFAPVPLVTIEPGEYEINKTISIPGIINFDFTDSKFFPPKGQEHRFDAIDASGQSYYNIYKLPEFHGFRRAFRFSTSNRSSSVVDISGGGFYNNIVGVDDTSYLASRSTVLSIHDFKSVGTDQVIRAHTDNAHIYNFEIEHTGWEGAAIFSQARMHIENGSFTTKGNNTETDQYGLIEQWTYSEPGHLVNPATKTIEDHDVGNLQPGTVGGNNRGIKINNVDVKGTAPLIVWEGETWQNVSNSNSLHNHIVLEDIELTDYSTSLIKINRDLPANIKIERVMNYDDTHPYIFFSPLSTDPYNQPHTYSDKQAINEHQVEDEAWQYRIYFGEINAVTSENISNDQTVHQFVYQPIRDQSIPLAEVKQEKINLTNQIMENRSSAVSVNAADFKEKTNSWSDAIQAAVNEASKQAMKSKERVLVTLSPNLYTIDKTIKLPNNVDIDFKGSVFVPEGIVNGRQTMTAIQAKSYINYYQLPEFIGFEKAFQFDAEKHDEAFVKIEYGGFYNNDIDIDDSGYQQSGKAQVEISNIRSTLSDTFINISSANAYIYDVFVTNSGANTPSFKSTARLYVSDFILTPYPAYEDHETAQKTWFAVYNHAEGMSEEEQWQRGLILDNGVAGGETGSVVNVRSYMNKLPIDQFDYLGNHIIFDTIQVEVGNTNIPPTAAMAIHQNLPAYIVFDMINGMSLTTQGYIWIAPEASLDHQDSEKHHEYIIQMMPGSELTRPAYSILSEDTSLDSLAYKAVPFDQTINFQSDHIIHNGPVYSYLQLPSAAEEIAQYIGVNHE